MRLGGGRRGRLRSRLLLLGSLGLLRLVMADRATSRSAQHPVVAGHMARNAADRRARYATGCIGRQRRSQEHGKSKNTN